MKHTRGFGLLESWLSKKRAHVADKLISPDQRNGSILDLGCGVEPFFLQNINFKNKYGLDKNLKATYQISKHNIENEELPFEDSSIEVITIIAVFDLIKQNKKAPLLQEIKRVLKPGGKFIVTLPCSWTNKIFELLAKLKLLSSEEVSDLKSPTLRIDEMIKRAGFKNIKTGYFEFWLNSWIVADK